MKHGGDTLSYRELYGGQIIDFSSNINPLGYPKELDKILLDGVKAAAVYPDIKYRNLKAEISSYIGCDKEEVLIGNGAVEIISNFSILFHRILVVVPCFAEYMERPRILNKEVIELPLKDDFSIDFETIAQVIQKGDLLILGNPNNPTGKRIPKALLMEMHHVISSKGAFLLLDEAFYEFCMDDYDSIVLFRESKNICIIRAATKFFALPGIRLGYGFASKEIAEKYSSIALPWCINVFAELAGSVIFKDKVYILQSKEHMALQREFLLKELKKLEGIIAYDTDCNFILIKLLQRTEEEIFNFLLKRGIMIRKGSSFSGLDHHFIRVAIKDYENNKSLLEGVKNFLQQK